MAVAKLFDFLGSLPGSVRISGFYNNIWREDSGQNAIPDFALDDISQTVLDIIKDDAWEVWGRQVAGKWQRRAG